MKSWTLLLIMLATTASAQGVVQVASTGDDQSLKRLSIEELSRIDVTSVSRHAEAVSDAAAAIVVVTADDIRRAGITMLPEALRLATGVAVARFDGRTWATSARGFNISTADKMMVLIDGRSVYTPLFSGVFWDVQDVVLEDVDRIEVIRGPGGTLWGANAVNGVINIITKRAADTQGALVTIGGGSNLGQTSVRYGGHTANGTAFRAYGKYRYRGAEIFDTGASAHDPLRSGQAGFRVDSDLSHRTALTVQGDAYVGLIGIFDRPDSDVSGANVLGRIAHTSNSGSQLQIQWYYDGTYRRVPRQFAEHRDTFDVEAQYRFTAARRHDIVSGVGYQVTRGATQPSAVLFFAPATRTSPLLNVFAQDDITIAPGRFGVIIGSKFEENDYTGFEVQPTARLRWTPGSRQTVWAAVSRAVRMPTRFDTDLRFTGLTPVVLLRGDPAFRSETVVAQEAGYRKQVGSLSVDVAGFVNEYRSLRTQEPTLPLGVPVVLMNKMSARTGGVEATAEFQAAPNWQLHAGYSWLKERFTLAPDSHDISGGTAEHDDPAHQVWLRSFLDLPGATELDATFRFVGALQTPEVPRYGELTLHAGWAHGRSLELSLVGDNLLHAHHPEFGNLTPREEYPRSVFTQATWRF